MTPAKALRFIEKLQTAISLLVIHGIITDSEREKARIRLDRWASSNGLRRKAKP